MSQPFDLSRFPDLPPEVVKAFGAVQFQFSVERAARLHEQAVVAEKEAFITELKALIDRLEGQVQDRRRTKFGPMSEKLDPAQLELALEDLETAIAETQARIAAVEDRVAASEPDPEKRQPRAPCKTRVLPESLPRDLRMIEPDTIVWSPLLRHWSERPWRRGCGDMVRIGEDRTERLDYIPARYQVIVTVRPRYAPVLDSGRGKTKTGYLWRCCAMTVAGTALRRWGWCSITGRGGSVSMPPRSWKALTARSRVRRVSKHSSELFARRTPMAAIPTWPRRNAWAVIQSD